MAQIIPAILTDSIETLGRRVKLMEGAADIVQIDVCDGEFVPNKTFDPLALKDIPTSIAYELHLMVTHPGQMVEMLYDLPNIARIIFHIEAVKFPTAEIEHIEAYGRKAVLAVNPETSLDLVRPYAYEADGVLFLGVHPGAQGRTFLPEVREKIKIFKTEHPAVPVWVDGGIHEAELKDIAALEVEHINIGSEIFSAQDPVKRLKELQALI